MLKLGLVNEKNDMKIWLFKDVEELNNLPVTLNTLYDQLFFLVPHPTDRTRYLAVTGSTVSIVPLPLTTKTRI